MNGKSDVRIKLTLLLLAALSLFSVCKHSWIRIFPFFQAKYARILKVLNFFVFWDIGM